MYGLSNKSHKWHYLYHQGPHETLMLNMFDSSGEVKATL
jgi:hypothetical protein